MSNEAMKQWLEALENIIKYVPIREQPLLDEVIDASESLRQAIADVEKQERGAPVVYQRREIGEGDWQDCTKVQYEYAQERPEMDTQIIASPKLAKQEQGEPVAFITPLMESQMFDDWCPYKGNPDPRVVWAAAIEAVNGLLLGATPQQRKPLTMFDTEKLAKQCGVEWTTCIDKLCKLAADHIIKE